MILVCPQPTQNHHDYVSKYVQQLSLVRGPKDAVYYSKVFNWPFAPVCVVCDDTTSRVECAAFIRVLFTYSASIMLRAWGLKSWHRFELAWGCIGPATARWHNDRPVASGPMSRPRVSFSRQSGKPRRKWDSGMNAASGAWWLGFVNSSQSHTNDKTCREGL